MKNAEIPKDQPDYPDAAIRCYQDGNVLFQDRRYPNATHLFGLAAECALKTFLLTKISDIQNIPHRHLPKLKNDVLMNLKDRRNTGLGKLLSNKDYMKDWHINNRYQPRQTFSKNSCETYRNHSQRTLHVAGIQSSL